MKPNKFLLTSLILLFVLFSCKKDSSPPQGTGSNMPPPTNPPPPSPAISGISPSSGKFSTVVTISGSNFNADTTRDTVWFNNVAAEVQQASATSLTVVVPKLAGTGAVTLRTAGTTATGPVFTYVYTTTVTTVAGNGTAGLSNSSGGGAEFSGPEGLTLNLNGSELYVADAGNNSIRGLTTGHTTSGGQGQMVPVGLASTITGNGAGDADGTLTSAKFSLPTGIVSDISGNMYVADNGNSVIRKITSGGTVSTIAGSVSGFADGTGSAAKFASPTGIAIDSAGNLYVSDLSNQRIRKITPAGVVSTIAGTNSQGFSDGTGSGAEFTDPFGLAVDRQGNIYVADVGNNRIRKITPAGVVTTVAGISAKGATDGAAATAQFFYPSGVAVDGQGNIYVADTYNNTIRLISTSGTVTTLAGNAGVFQGFKDGDASVALFNKPTGILVDASGNIYVADSGNNAIRKIAIE